MTGARNELEEKIIKAWTEIMPNVNRLTLSKAKGVVKVNFIAEAKAQFVGANDTMLQSEPINRAVWHGERFVAIEYDVFKDATETEIETRIIALS